MGWWRPSTTRLSMGHVIAITATGTNKEKKEEKKKKMNERKEQEEKFMYGENHPS